MAHGADERLRDAERLAAASPSDPRLGAALLTARVRVGLLAREVLDLLAEVGDLAAREAGGAAAAVGSAPERVEARALSEFVEGLAKWGSPLLASVARALVRAALTSPAYAALGAPRQRAVDECLCRIDAWFEHSTDERRVAVGRCLGDLSAVLVDGGAVDDRWSLILAVTAAGHAVTKRTAPEAARLARKCADHVARLIGEDAARVAVRGALSRWSRGEPAVKRR